MSDFWNGLPGSDGISADFCNLPVRVDQQWNDEPVVAVLLCGHFAGHEGPCDELGDLR